jgi:hypothetical protein
VLLNLIAGAREIEAILWLWRDCASLPIACRSWRSPALRQGRHAGQPGHCRSGNGPRSWRAVAAPLGDIRRQK